MILYITYRLKSKGPKKSLGAIRATGKQMSYNHYVLYLTVLLQLTRTCVKFYGRSLIHISNGSEFCALSFSSNISKVDQIELSPLSWSTKGRICIMYANWRRDKWRGLPSPWDCHLSYLSPPVQLVLVSVGPVTNGDCHLSHLSKHVQRVLVAVDRVTNEDCQDGWMDG